MDTCYLCNGKLRKKNIDIVRYFGEEPIALNDVPALVCERCGNRYFEAKVSAKIDRRIQEVLRKKYNIQRITIPVIQF